MPTTIVDMFEQSEGPADESTMVGQTTHKWGGFAESRGYPLGLDFNVQLNQEEILGQSYANLDSGGNYPADPVKVNSSILVNGIPYHAVYGKADLVGGTYIADTVRDITNFTTTQVLKPRYHCAEVLGTLKEHEVFSVLFHDLNTSHIIGFPITFDMVGKGYKHQISAITLPTPTFPGTETGGFDILNTLEWNNVALTKPFMIQTKATQTVKATIGDDGYYVTITEWSPIFSAMVIGFRGVGNSGIWDDFHAKTKRSLQYKTLKGSDPTQYLDVNSAANIVRSLVPVKVQGEIISFTAVIEMQNPVITARDGINDSFYTIPT